MLSNRATLRRGDLVEVRSAAEILATLDDLGALESMPFMPEMLARIGKRFRVAARAEKVCDTIEWVRSLRVADTVLLEDLRCDGCAHGGCQAGCLLYWKEAWLRPVDADEPPDPPSPRDRDAFAQLEKLTASAVAVGEGAPGPVRHRCQATELVRSSAALHSYDPRPYFKEYTSGNISLRRFLRVGFRAIAYGVGRKVNLVPWLTLSGNGAHSRSDEPLGLQAGDWVEVKSRAEIAETLTTEGRHRGLWFDREMLPFCGSKFRVRNRVNRIINERDGSMIEFKTDCIILDKVVCSGDFSNGRWFCTRAIFPYWRECWLKRVPDEALENAAAKRPANVC